jgi:hypothetical protein
MAIVIPRITDVSGEFILREYLEEYNRDLTEKDYQKMNELLSSSDDNKLQQFVDIYVRKITFGRKNLYPSDLFFQNVLKTNHLEFIKLVYKKLPYDYKAYLILSIDFHLNSEMSLFFKDKISKFGDDYDEDFPKIQKFLV